MRIIKWVLCLYAQGRLIRVKQYLNSSTCFHCFDLRETIKKCHTKGNVVWDLMKFHLGPEKNKSSCDTLQLLDGPSMCGE